MKLGPGLTPGVRCGVARPFSPGYWTQVLIAYLSENEFMFLKYIRVVVCSCMLQLTVRDVVSTLFEWI